MEITPRELRDTEIPSEFRGYDRDAVNEMLDRAAAALEHSEARIRELGDRLSQVQAETGRTRETEDILQRTLLLAQRAADEAVAEAQAKARQMLDDAQISSRKMLAEAEADARRRGEAERRRLEEEVLDLAQRRDALLADVEALTRFEADYRDRMARALEADLTALRTRPPAAPGSRPEPSDVELPVLAEAVARPQADEHDAQPTGAVDMQALMADADARDADTPRADAGSGAPGPEAPTGLVAQEQVVPRAPTPEAASTDERVLDRPPPDAGRAIDLGDEELEAEVLDDDAFFATLRDAVHDESPLGPRDEEEGRLSFFDQDDDEDRSSFRDVFRRRR